MSRALVLTSIALASALCLLPASAAAQQGNDKAADEQAKALFNAGAQAYAAGRYTAAVQAFEGAYKKAPRPAILFSMAQAHRRQYFIDKKPENLQQAIRNYRLYLDQVPQGGRRADAASALSELEVISQRLGVNDTAAASPSPSSSEAVGKTRVTVTSPTPGARVSLDGRPAVEVPLLEEVTPGKHKVRISADGHVTVERDILAIENDLVALDQDLREQSGRLEIKAPNGAQLAIDGRFVGTLPVPLVDVAPGKHFIAITTNGYKPFTREIDLRRGQSQRVEAELSRTTQRKVSYAFFAASGLAAVGGVGLTFAALAEHGQAEEIAEERRQSGIVTKQYEAFRDHVERRDTFRDAAVILLGTGAVFGFGGFVFYAFDQPAQPLPPARSDTKPSPTNAPTQGPSIEIAAAPVLSPGFAGVGFVGRF
ncbi:PEGA domain-containing protein [Polyangium aurulentum]|uniref:PEGA domain-containing protein n=1 Tax=Polyangium aurulentum TaxID=2567896 RepID=UPI0010AE4694|nr:PEGA domain-containing protein [Polyangium aurulentum]UQA56039.1 PEGA domain-containing protein [Polyangium aurulentum]